MKRYRYGNILENTSTLEIEVRLAKVHNDHNGYVLSY